MNTKEKKAMQPTNEVIANLLKQRNKGTEDCVTSTFIARQIGLTALELNSFLIDKKILKRYRKERKLVLAPKYKDMGIAKCRSRFGYDNNGQIFEIVFPVWTKKGVDFLAEKLGATLEYK